MPPRVSPLGLRHSTSATSLPLSPAYPTVTVDTRDPRAGQRSDYKKRLTLPCKPLSRSMTPPDTDIQILAQLRDPATRERIMAVSAPLVYSDGRVVGALRFVTSTKNADRFVLFSLLIALAFALAVTAIVYVSSKYYFKSILVPVSEITETAKRIAGGSYGVQIQKKFDDEIGELADTINDMSNKIAQTEKLQSEFMSSVSHELRTPLTAITGWGETLLAGDDASEETRRGITIILRETKRLTSMVEELLVFTRMQDDRFTLNVQTCDIRADFEDTVFMYGSRLSQEGIVRADAPGLFEHSRQRRQARRRGQAH